MYSSLQVELGIDDYRAFLSFVQTKGRTDARQNASPLLAKLTRFLIGTGVGVVIMVSVNALGGMVHVPSAVGATLLTLAIVLSTIYHQFQKLQASMEPQPGGAVIGIHHYECKDDGLHITSPYGTTHLAWRGIQRLEETSTHFFILIDRCIGFIVPKRSFPGEAQQAQFKDLLATRCRT